MKKLRRPERLSDLLGHTGSKTKNLCSNPIQLSIKSMVLILVFCCTVIHSGPKAHCSNMTIDTVSSVSNYHTR